MVHLHFSPSPSSLRCVKVSRALFSSVASPSVCPPPRSPPRHYRFGSRVGDWVPHLPLWQRALGSHLFGLLNVFPPPHRFRYGFSFGLLPPILHLCPNGRRCRCRIRRRSRIVQLSRLHLAFQLLQPRSQERWNRLGYFELPSGLE